MADLPRYQNLGVQYADMPRINPVAQQVQAQGLSQLSQNLDRMFAYAEESATTEAKKQAIKYAVENPPTNAQLNEAISNPAALKVKGAGAVFQETYQSVVAQRLSSELLLKADAEADTIERNFQMGQITKVQAQQRLADLMDGQSAAMIAVSPEYSLKHRASLASVASTSYKKISELELKTFLGQKKAEYTAMLPTLGKQLEDIITYQIDSIDPQTGKPIDITKMLNSKLQKYADSVGILGGNNEIWEKAMIIAESAKKNVISDYASSKDFGANRVDKLNKILAGDFGKMQPIWNSMGGDQQKLTRQSIIEQFTFQKNARDSFLAAEQFDANDILRKMYMSNNPSQYFKQLQSLTVDPSTLKSAREWLDNYNTQGAKQDDLQTLATIQRNISAGTATVEDVISAKKSGLLKNDTAKTFVVNIANPSDDVTWGVKQIELALNIQNSMLPPEINSKEGKSIAINTKNTGELDLRKFASTPDADGKYPTSEQIRNKASVIRDNAKALIKPYLLTATEKSAEGVRLQLKELNGVNLDDDAAFNAAIAQAVKNKANEGSISAAKIGRQNYLKAKKQAEE
jgi:hypothetical protein